MATETPIKVQFKKKSGEIVSFPAKKIDGEKKGRGRPAGRKDDKPRKFTHRRFKKKAESLSGEKIPVLDQTSKVIESGASGQTFPKPVVMPIAAREAEQILQSKPDTEIFGHGSPPKPAENKPEENAAGEMASGEIPAGDLPPLNDVPPKAEEPKKETPMDAAEAEQIASMIWGMELNLCGAFFGREMLPRKFVAVGADMSKGEIPFDESEMVRGAWRDYLVSLGMVVLSPLKKLWLAHAFYFVPRTGFVIAKIRARFSKKRNAESPGAQASQTAREEKSQAESRSQSGREQAEEKSEPMPQAPSEKPESSVHNTEGFR